MWEREWAGEEIACLWPAWRGSTPCTPHTPQSCEQEWSLHHRGEESGIEVTRAVLAFLLATPARPHLGDCVNCPVSFRRWSHQSLLLQLPHPQSQPLCASANAKNHRGRSGSKCSQGVYSCTQGKEIGGIAKINLSF